jgi:anhydro-N-acetylmuramic acid kinase
MTHSPMHEQFTIGLMSGTSLDGVDGVLASFESQTGQSLAPRDDVAAQDLGPSVEGSIGQPPSGRVTPRVIGHAYLPFPPDLRAEFLALNSPGANEIHRAHLAGNALARLYAEVVQRLLSQTPLTAPDIGAIGAHGQTIRHRPLEFDGVGYTCQVNNPSLLAELTGIAVIADFRSRDLAAGGQGAPLVPGFHRAIFGRSDRAVAVLNIGGIANLSLIEPNGGPIMGFDCGPGNVLMDAWAQAHTGQSFDADGRFAQGGLVYEPLLRQLLSEPFFHSAPPKSTGRDLFNFNWLQAHLSTSHADGLHAQDVQATLAELTARTATEAAHRHLGTSPTHPIELLVCGGGALNHHLMSRLAANWNLGPVTTTDTQGIPAMQVEACAFAWLAAQHLQRQAGNLSSVTGARGPRVLGAFYPV